ncbi:hypothetical protein COT87_02135 [Candidatus Collierbacteria bacterium CG10_big_fil_rev_8_21_14_0_10_44_9]|uniref:Glycosyltransferase RgtA/B/C/D-like domain-containing protein n=1 Tax=Candidatus Collierbacteria bacterium CG10_big_fil_rev_8_21_14_0_10_44_9 TaxID=1974535 RepID=A0A2H0VIN3_9BACT|nr:MAG: hypothetical protein COT87_02135 [Candidatus Collierbacteria bacterium CG10_big_fil_rev_8_21_14_0_10_44_9]
MMKQLKSLYNWCNKYEWIIFLITLVLVLRLPSFIMPHYYGDEEIYFVMGRAWKSGVALYRDMFDHKPPLIYVMAGIAPTMFAFRGLLALLMILHTVLFWNLAKLIWNKTRPILAYLASFIFVIVTTLPTFEGLTVNAELLMMIPVTGAALILWNMRAGTGVRPYGYLLAGLLGGIGWLFKIPVAADMVAIGLFFFAFNKKTFKESALAFFSWSFVAYALAFVTPLALSFIYYYLKGTGPDYLATMVNMNLGYVSSWSTNTYTFNPFKSGLIIRGIILGVYTLVLYLFRKKIDKTLVFIFLWLAFSLFGALLSARPYPHYLQEMAAPVALLVPFIFVAENVISWIIIAVIVGICTLAQWQINFWGYPTISVYKTYWQYLTKKISWDEYLTRFDNAPRNYSVAKYLNERLMARDNIYIWGTDSTTYNLTNKLPSGGKYIVSFHVHDLKKYDYVMENLNRTLPKYIVVLPNSGDFPELSSLLDHSYILVKEIDNVSIYLSLN